MTNPVAGLLRGRPAFSTEKTYLGAAAAVTVVAAVTSAVVHPAVGLALGIALAAIPVLVTQPLAGLALTVAVITLLPFAALPLGIGFNPTFLDGALGAVYLIFVTRLATRRAAVREWPPLALGSVLVMGVFAAAFVAGLAHGTPTKNEIRTFAELWLGAGLLVVVAGHVDTLVAARRLLALILGSAALAALIGLCLYLLPDAWEVRLLSALGPLDYPTGPSVLRYLNDDPSRLQRATGTSVDPNSFGGMLAVVAALAAPQVLSRSPLIPRRFVAPGLVLIGLALLATVSRGSLLALAAAGAFVVLLRDKRLLVVAGMCGAIVITLASLGPWTSGYLEHFAEGVRLEDRATQMRLGEYGDAVELIKRYPFLGVGFGGVRDIDLYRGVSSLYLIIAETTGLIGLTAFSGLLIAFLSYALAAWRRTRPGGLSALILGSAAAVVAAMVGGVFDHYFFTYPHAFALLWLVVGLGVGAGRAADASRSRHPVNTNEGAEPAPGPAPSLQGGGDIRIQVPLESTG